MATSVPPSSTAELPTLSDDAVQVRMMRELFVRTRESALVGFLPVFLIIWSHWGAQPTARLMLWAAGAWLVLAFRVVIAHLYLISPSAQEARGRTWYWMEWLGSAGLALVWVSSLTMVGTGQIDPLFYLRLVFLVALVAFLLSALGIDMRLYASFMGILVLGVLFQLHRHYPEFVRELPVVNYAFVVYAVMLLVRSRGEQRRTREWVRARLTQRLLLDQLNQTIRQELQMHEALRMKTLELEQTNRKLGELATHDGLTGAFRRGHIEGELRRQVKAVDRHAGDFSVMLLDIDFFKRVNDQHGHPVGDAQRFLLIVRDVDRRGLEPLVQFLDLGAHGDAQLGVEVGQGFVEQKQLGVAGQGPAHGHALALPARQLARLAVQQVPDLQHLRHTFDRCLAFDLGHLADFQAKSDVLRHGHVGVKRIALEHHRNVAVFAGQTGHLAVPDVDAARGGVVKARDHGQQGGFATTRGADQDQKFTGADLEVDALEDVGGLVVGFADVAYGQSAHGVTPSQRRRSAHAQKICPPRCTRTVWVRQRSTRRPCPRCIP